MEKHSDYLYKLYLTLCKTKSDIIKDCRKFMREKLEKQNNVHTFTKIQPIITYKGEKEKIISIERVPKSGIFAISEKKRIKLRQGCGVPIIDFIILTNTVEQDY